MTQPPEKYLWNSSRRFPAPTVTSCLEGEMFAGVACVRNIVRAESDSQEVLKIVEALSTP